MKVPYAIFLHTLLPMMPLSQHATKFSRSTHKIRFICDVSKLTIVLVSLFGHSIAPETAVPPPNGIITNPLSHANFTNLTTSS